jgi:hypothetical protein
MYKNHFPLSLCPTPKRPTQLLLVQGGEEPSHAGVLHGNSSVHRSPHPAPGQLFSSLIILIFLILLFSPPFKLEMQTEIFRVMGYFAYVLSEYLNLS